MANRQLPCSGPCRKRFRPDDVQPDTDDRRIVDFLLTVDPTPSQVAWYCPDCRWNGEAIGIPQDPLPPEMWLMIFQQLDDYELLPVRLTCARWRNIVDWNRCMRDKLCVYFWEITLNRNCAPENLIRTSQAQLLECKIYGFGAWWSWYGAGLTVLHLNGCDIELPVFLEMLRETVNLVRLTLGDMNYKEIDMKMTVNFQMEKLQSLSCDEIFDFFGQMFPRLNKLSFPCRQGFKEEIVCQMLQTAQDTLKGLTCAFTPHILKQMAGMRHLQLTTVENQSDHLDALLKLSQMQPFIEDINVAATSSVMYSVALNLTRLKKVCVRIKHGPNPPYFIPTFLVKAPKVTSITLMGSNEDPITFGSVTAPNLKCLHLYSVTLHDRTLRDFLSSCTNLQELKLYFCALNSWLDVFSVNFKSLRRIHLFRTDAIIHEDCQAQLAVNPVTELDIYMCNVSTDILLQLVPNRFRQLKKVKLAVMEGVVDEVIQAVVSQPKLDELFLYDCANLTDASVEAICGSSSLRELSIYDCEGMSEEGQRRIKEFKKTLGSQNV